MTYTEAIEALGKDFNELKTMTNGDSYNYNSIILSGEAKMLAMVFGKDQREVEKDIRAEAKKSDC